MREWGVVQPRRAVSAVAVCLLIAGLGGCATGSTSSFTQSPIFFAEDDGSLVDAEGSAATLAASGDFTSGVPQFSAVAGNSILPVNSPAALSGAGLSTNVATATLNGGVAATADLGLAGTSIALSNQGAAAGLALGSTGASAALGTGGAALALAPAGLPPVSAEITTPSGVASAASTVIATGSGALPTRGVLLGASTLASTITASAGVVANPLLATVATQQQKVRLCALKRAC